MNDSGALPQKRRISPPARALASMEQRPKRRKKNEPKSTVTRYEHEIRELYKSGLSSAADIAQHIVARHTLDPDSLTKQKVKNKINYDIARGYLQKLTTTRGNLRITPSNSDDVAVASDDNDEDTAKELTRESMQRLIDIGKLYWHEDEHEQYMLVHVYVGKWETVRTREYCSSGFTLSFDAKPPSDKAITRAGARPDEVRYSGVMYDVDIVPPPGELFDEAVKPVIMKLNCLDGEPFQQENAPCGRMMAIRIVLKQDPVIVEEEF